MEGVTEPEQNPPAGESLRPWTKDVNRAIAELQSAMGTNSDNLNTVMYTAEVAIDTANGAQESIDTVVIPSIAAPLAIPAPPNNLHLVAASSGWTDTGNPIGEATISWDAVTQDVNSNDLPIVGYEVLTATAAGVLVARNINPNPSFETALTGTATNVTAAQSTAWAAQGANSLKLTPSAVSNDSYYLLPATVLGMQPNKTYTIIATIHLAAPLTGTLHANSRQLGVKAGATTTFSPFVPDNVAGDSEIRITTTMGATVVSTDGVLLYNGAATGGGDVYWDNVAVIEVPSEEEEYEYNYFDGDTPDTTGRLYTWTSDPNNSASSFFGSMPGSLIGTVTSDEDQPITYIVQPLLPGRTYEVQVRAMSAYGVPGILSGVLQIVMPAAPVVALEPSPPLADTRLGVVSVAWDGYLGGAPPLAGFLYVFAEFAREGTEDWAQFGPQLRKAGSVTLTTEPVGSTVRIRFRSVDNLGSISSPSPEVEVVIIGVTGPDIEANSVTANHIEAGSISVTHLEPSVGEQLDISANEAVTIIAGDLEATNDNLEAMQTVYSFTETEATISANGSNFTLALDNDSIEIREGGVPVSWWNAGQMFVPSFVGDTVVLGNHQLEKYGTGTVMRAL